VRIFLSSASCNEKENETMKILLANKGNTNPQIAHLQFARADTQAKNCKRAFFANSQIIKCKFVK
jgi:hypothetical protein